MSSQHPHYLQSTDWAHLRPEAGWSVQRIDFKKGQIFAYSKKTPAGNLVYIPGFMPAASDDLKNIANQLKNQNNLACKIEPCEPTSPQAEKWFIKAGWKPARNIQYHYTVYLDLTRSENDLWMSMKARCRQEINYARRDKVQVIEAEPTEENFQIMYDLLQDTSKRKTFGIRDKQYAIHLWLAFAGSGHLKLLFVKIKGEIVAGGVFITDGKNRAWYKDAGSKAEFSKHFGPRLLLWEAALLLKKEGYKIFDLGGIPDPQTYKKSHMKGIYIFKTAFSREITPMMPAYELPLRPLIYPVWRRFEPTAIKAKRAVSKIKNRN